MIEPTPTETLIPSTDTVWYVPDTVSDHCKVNIYASVEVCKAYPHALKYDVHGKSTDRHIDLQIKSLSMAMIVLNRIRYYHAQNALLTQCGITDLIDNAYTRPGAFRHFITTEMCKVMTSKTFPLPYCYADTHIMQNTALYQEDLNIVRKMEHEDYDAVVAAYQRYGNKEDDGFTLTLLNRFDKFEIVIAAKMGSHATKIEHYTYAEDEVDTTPSEEKIHTTIGAFALIYYHPRPLIGMSTPLDEM